MRRGDDWNHYTYTYGEGREASIRFDVACAMMPAPGSHETSVRVRVEGPPTLEEQLDGLLAEVDCWLVGIVQFPGATVYAFQVEDVSAFERVSLPGVLERSTGWGYFDERVCPTEVDWQRISDREQLERLDLDLEVERPVAHGFYGEPTSLEQIRARLETEGMVLRAHEGQRLVMVRTHALQAVSASSIPLARYAQSLGVAYDGWSVVDLNDVR